MHYDLNRYISLKKYSVILLKLPSNNLNKKKFISAFPEYMREKQNQGKNKQKSPLRSFFQIISPNSFLYSVLPNFTYPPIRTRMKMNISLN